jgi:precorrin-4/cobalt-precorrin-4 C11-methyltransferase
MGRLNNIAEKVKAAGIGNFSQILVGDFIEGEYERSLLYDPKFTHGFRKGVN